MPPPTARAARLSYSGANAVAATVQEHFTRHIARGESSDASAEPLLPEVGAIEAIIDAAFWASLRREEEYVPKISLALLPPDLAVRPLLFARPLPLDPAALARLAPAVERPGIHLGVWRNGDGELHVWGTTRRIPRLCFVLEVVRPGLLVVKHRHNESAKFVNVAVLEGDDVKVLDERSLTLPDCPPPLASLLDFASSASSADPQNILVQLAVSMRSHGRGGSLLVVPSEHSAWRESIVQPVSYAVSPPFSELTDLVLGGEVKERRQRHRDEAIRKAVDIVAGLTAVDGAAVITERYDLLAFGAKIMRRKGWPVVEQVLMTEPIQGSTPVVVPPTQLGGTRHYSATQFAQDQRDSVALVASQDGRFTIFAWSACENMVHAHRVETLLL